MLHDEGPHLGVAQERQELGATAVEPGANLFDNAGDLQRAPCGEGDEAAFLSVEVPPWVV